MKKYLLAILLLPLLIMNVYASSVPYEWNVDGEKVNVGQPNKAGTASLEKDGKVVTLFLKNYDGGKLKLECYGTGQENMVFIINLEGENKITSDDIGIDISSKVDFQGTGKLTINAPKPLKYEDIENQKVVDLSPKQVEETTGEKEEVKDTNEKEEIPTLITEKEEDTPLISNKDDDNDWLVRFLGVLVLISVGVISFLVVKLNTKSKKETQ